MKRGYLLPLAALALLALPALAPFAQPGYFWGAHDARHNVYFLFEFDRAWQDGIFFPRWAPDFTFGYGYPFWIVYAPLATYLGQAFHLLGFGWEASVKLVLGLSIVASGLAMYGFVTSWAGRRAGLVAAVAYIYIPYHLVDLYVRAALAESVALIFLPLCLWAFRETVIRPRLAALTAAALAFGGLMLTSNLVALVFASVLAAYLAMHVLRRLNAAQPWRDWSSASTLPLLGNLLHLSLTPLLALALGFGLSAAFSLPALTEFRFVNREQWYGQYYNPFNHFIYWSQLFSPTWGFGISIPGPDDRLSFQLGIAPTLLSVLGLAAALTRRTPTPAPAASPGRTTSADLRAEAWFFAALSAVAVFLMLPVSAWAWQALPNVKFAQFPWRYLMLTAVGLAILPAMLVAEQPAPAAAKPRIAGDDKDEVATGLNRWRSFVALCLCGLILLGSYAYLQVEVAAPTPEQGPVSYAALMRFEQSANEMTGVSVFADVVPTWSAVAEDHVHGRPVTTHVDYSRVPQNATLAVDVREHGSAHELVWVHSGEPDQRLVFNVAYFPGWTAYLYADDNNRPGRLLRKLTLSEKDIIAPFGQIAVPLEPGEFFLLLRFEDTPVRVLGKALSILSVVALLIAWVIRWRWRAPARRVG
ncbi:hypothetical protein [Candidatus Amarolinea aalborgensis]|uniref:hypothetical protein n=1 Tax=Candidatus Amarolinea aalborgensis TaxID=2249329 RepID=UPI003BF96393